MKIRTNSPSVLDLVIRLLTQSGVALKKLPQGNEVKVTNDDITEGELRLMLQEKLDEEKFDFDDDFVLVQGNSIWSYNRIMKEMKAIKKADNTDGISGYFYKFMYLNFTIAHGNMRGWMIEYPSFDKVMKMLEKVEPAGFQSDVSRILADACKLSNKKKDGTLN